MDEKVIRRAQLENIATLVVTAVVVIGLAVILGSYHCLWGLLIMLNINTVTSKKC